MIIDVHAHHQPMDFMKFVRDNGLGRPPPPGIAPPPPSPPFEARFGMMEAAGVGRQILSSAMSLQTNDATLGREGAEMLNDALAGCCAGHPRHLSFWAALPLPHVEAALEEIDRALALGAAGFILPTFVLDGSIAAPEFMPVYEELDRRSAVVFLHPCQNGLCSPLVNDWGLTVCAGASMEDAIAAMHLIVAGIPTRFPRIRFIVPHFGGILPMLLQRLDGQMSRGTLEEAPSVSARRFFYDTVGWGSRAALLAAVEAFGSAQLVPGSDYPILLPWESYPTTFDHIRNSGLPADAIDAILHRNAQALTGLEA